MRMLSHGFAPMHGDTCRKRKRQSEGTANLVDPVLPEHVPIVQWVVSLPYLLRYPLAFDPRLLLYMLRSFTDKVSARYSRHHLASQTGM
jgi:hypothetical protein